MTIRTGTVTIALLISLLTWNCEGPSAVEEMPEEPGLSYADRYGLFQEKKKNDPSDFLLKFGVHNIYLHEMAQYPAHSGGIELDLNDFLSAIEGPIAFFHQGRKLDYQIINLRKYSLETGDSRLWKPYPGQVGSRLEPEVVKEIREKVGIGSGIQIRLAVPQDSTDYYASLLVKNPFGGYVPPMKVRSNYFSQVYGFQLIQKDDRPVILRIDTTNQATRHVLDLYDNKSTYKILHIPDFQTRRRMWRVDLFSNKDIVKTLLVDNPYDILLLPEYVDYDPRKLNLRWGKMEARLNSENYTLPFFRKNIRGDYLINVGEKELKIKKAHLIIKRADFRPEAIVTSDLTHPEVIKRLFRIGGDCSVYLDKIVVEDHKGVIYYFPEAFAFHLEKSQEFELELAETRTIEKARLQVKHAGKELRIECTSMPVVELLSFLLDVPSSNILMSGFNEQIYLDMLFVSETLGEAEGKQLMLTKLQHYLKFAVERVGASPVLALYLQDTVKLKNIQASEKEDRKVRFSQDKGFKNISLSGIPLSELAELIAYDLNIPCVDLTETDYVYSLELQYEDRFGLTAHLQDYGLILDWYEEDVKILVSRY